MHEVALVSISQEPPPKKGEMVMAPRKLSLDGDEFELKKEESFDIDDLIHPAQAFSHPSDVVNDPILH
jgi:hypothetical protein